MGVYAADPDILVYGGGGGVGPTGGSGSGGNYKAWLAVDNTPKGSSSSFKASDNPLSKVINPIIISISAVPHDTEKGTAVLNVVAQSEGQSVHHYQWQKQEADDTWNNIPGATSETFNHTKLPSGTHVFRCIVSNGTGGRTISDPVTITIP